MNEKGVVEYHLPTDEWRHYVEPERPKRQTFKRTRDSRRNDRSLIQNSESLVPKMVLS